MPNQIISWKTALFLSSAMLIKFPFKNKHYTLGNTALVRNKKTCNLVIQRTDPNTKRYCTQVKLVRKPPSLFPTLAEWGFFCRASSTLPFAVPVTRAGLPNPGTGSNLEFAQVQLLAHPTTSSI